MTTLEKQIKNARPLLRTVSPLSHWTVSVMGWFNIFLGVALYFAVDSERIPASYLIVNEFLTFKFWGLVFILIGIMKLFALYTNNWVMARRSLMVGVSIKAAWAVALTIRSLVSPGTFFLNILWIAIALLQMGAYVWFMPPAIQTNKQGVK